MMAKNSPWLQAILSAETANSWLHHGREDNKESDLRPLVALLRSNEPLTEDDRKLLADLLERPTEAYVSEFIRAQRPLMVGA